MSTEKLTYLSQPDKETEARFFDFQDYRLYAFCQKNKEKSTHNEDALFLKESKNGLVFGVCDGVGGHPMGREAATLAAQTLCDVYGTSPFEINPTTLFEEVNRGIRELKVGALTTIAFGVLEDNWLRFYSIGDSEILYTNNRGDIRYANIPHSPVGHGLEAGLIEPTEALDQPNRNIVNNLLGSEIFYFEGSSSIEVKKGHSVLIASDGVFDNIPKEDLSQLISSSLFDEAALKLDEMCRKNLELDTWKKDDDISFVFLRRIRA